MSSRRGQGFTLLEMGFVLGVVGLLSLGIYLTSQSRFENARMSRLQTEMEILSRHSGYALKRSITRGTGGEILFQSSASATAVALRENVPICFDLSNGQGSSAVSGGCPSTSNLIDVANGLGLPFSYQQTPAGNFIDTVNGSGLPLKAGAHTPYCLPYILCLYKNRREVVTCVPPNVISGPLAASHACNVCWASQLSCVLNSQPNDFSEYGEGFAEIPATYNPNLNPVF